jgi:hypothetical protein
MMISLNDGDNVWNCFNGNDDGQKMSVGEKIGVIEKLNECEKREEREYDPVFE